MKEMVALGCLLIGVLVTMVLFVMHKKDEKEKEKILASFDAFCEALTKLQLDKGWNHKCRLWTDFDILKDGVQRAHSEPDISTEKLKGLLEELQDINRRVLSGYFLKIPEVQEFQVFEKDATLLVNVHTTTKGQ